MRLLASDDAAGALAVFDEREPHADNAFQLCDQTSLLWRLELAGCDVGDRWDALADQWDEAAERHICAFLDVHAALAFARRPGHPGAARWFDGLRARCGAMVGEDRAGGFGGTAGESDRGGDNDRIFSENERIFIKVVVPLSDAFRGYAAGDADGFVALADALGSSTRRIGGSIAQRDLIALTRRAAAAGVHPSRPASAAEGLRRIASPDAEASAADMPYRPMVRLLHSRPSRPGPV